MSLAEGGADPVDEPTGDVPRDFGGDLVVERRLTPEELDIPHGDMKSLTIMVVDEIACPGSGGRVPNAAGRLRDDTMAGFASMPKS